jgi:hypothetical protein
MIVLVPVGVCTYQTVGMVRHGFTHRNLTEVKIALSLRPVHSLKPKFHLSDA